MSDKSVVFSGGFDPIHSGHIQCIDECRKLGRVILALNSDEWLARKKGRSFMPFEERKAVLDQFKNVLEVISFDDSDNTACDAIQHALDMWPSQTIVFANGGDRTSTNIPEMEKFKDNPRVEFVFGIGGDYKKNSSSWILEEWKHPSMKRHWGKFITYYDSTQSKVKRLILEPGKSISMQQHKKRSEYWFVESGKGTAYTLDYEGKEVVDREMITHTSHNVIRDTWHRLENTGTEPLCIIEIQYGSECTEEDIIRK